MPDLPYPRLRLSTTPGQYLQTFTRLLTTRYATGPNVQSLEAQVAALTGTAHCIAVPMARTGIYLALKSLESRGEKVILSPYTVSEVVNMVMGNMPLTEVFAGKRVLVTGHTGFKGSWLALWLKELGADVSGIALAPEYEGSHFELLGLDRSSADLIDISGGTYFPGAKAASDGAGRGPYFIEFAKRARAVTAKPLMLTGGFKTRAQAEDAVASGAVDVIGLARALVLEPSLPDLWKSDRKPEPVFPRFSATPEGGITAWYTMRLTEIAADVEAQDFGDLGQAIRDYEARDKARTDVWLRHFTDDRVGRT